MGDRLRVGVVGAGNIASVAQLPALVVRDDVELTTLVSRREDPSALVRRWGFSSSTATVAEALEHDLDALFVLTPRSEHVTAVDMALTAGVDVFCEKPLATSASDAERLADLSEENGRILMVGLNRRFAPVYEAGQAMFRESGASFCVAQKNRRGSEYRATFENSIHMVDLLRWYCGGQPMQVDAHAAGDDQWQEDGLSALIRFDNGNTGVLVAARNAGRWEENLDAYGGGTSVHIDAPERLSVTTDGTTTVREMREEAFGWATATASFGFARAVDHFVECVQSRREPLTSGREAAQTQILLDQILAAADLPTVEDEGRVWASHAQA